MEYVQLNNGIKMSMLGCGVYQVTKDECESCIPAALTARIPKNNALLVTIFLISGFIHITSEMVLVKVYVRGQGNMTILETEEYIK